MSRDLLVLPTLAGDRITLRAWRTTDVAIVQEASGDQLITALTTVPQTPGEPEALAFIERQHERLRSREGYVFAIADAEDRAIGHIGLFPAGDRWARASIGYWIGPSQRRRGYAADALTTLTAWAVQLDSLDRVELYVEPWNEGSWRAAERAGYLREGLLRAWERVDGSPRDMYMYAQLTNRIQRPDP
ncbi:GNAT family N-acetyltransferase [Plantibacter sp. VKM Ac-2880]|uniref:GNAT family N-acetyltransferase n=1 Tax=Plantibacter sp. VKM Ac-2880 TaxID=2783827 RepID=UPI00188F22E1|nr:GNAT family protein [Plantibacter sp. VKM Ac-2880]MBF4570881.1 GNAT family N-acetyltransferase [Plantibacter sp. VKM Ac-2880]